MIAKKLFLILELINEKIETLMKNNSNNNTEFSTMIKIFIL